MSDTATTRTRRRRKAPSAQTVFMVPGTGEDESTPIEEVVHQDEIGVADTVAEMLDALRGVTTDDAKIMVYRGDYRGKWAFLTTMWPPINADTLLDDLKTKYGGGSYNLRIYANGKIVTTKQIVIGGAPKTPKDDVEEVDGKKDTDMTQLLLAQAAQSKSDMVSMMTMMMKSSADQQAMMTAMMQNSSQQMLQLLTVLLPAMMGGKDTPASLLQAIMPLMKQGESTESMIKTMIAMKELVGGGEGTGEGGLMERMVSGAMPLLGKIIESTQPGQQQPQESQQLQLPYNPPIQQPRPQPAAPPGYILPDQPQDLTAVPPQGDASETILRLVAPDVLYFASRGHDPSLAAEAVVNILQRHGVTTEHVQELVLRFTSSPDWIADLAARGIDLTQQREWAAQFLQELVTQFTASNASQTNT